MKEKSAIEMTSEAMASIKIPKDTPLYLTVADFNVLREELIAEGKVKRKSLRGEIKLQHKIRRERWPFPNIIIAENEE